MTEIINFPTKKVSILESCILYGKQTNVKKDTPVHEREYYVDGAGQLDADCYNEVYTPKTLREVKKGRKILQKTIKRIY